MNTLLVYINAWNAHLLFMNISYVAGDTTILADTSETEVLLNVLKTYCTGVVADNGRIIIVGDYCSGSSQLNAVIYQGGERWVGGVAVRHGDNITVVDNRVYQLSELSHGAVIGVVLDRNPLLQVERLVERYGVVDLAYMLATAPGMGGEQLLDLLVGYAVTLHINAGRLEALARSIKVPNNAELLPPFAVSIEAYNPNHDEYTAEVNILHPCVIHDDTPTLCEVKVRHRNAKDEAERLYDRIITELKRILLIALNTTEKHHGIQWMRRISF